MNVVVQFLDKDILVVLEHLCQQGEIVWLAIMSHDNPLNILEADSLAAHGFGTFLKHAHIHVMKRCYN